MVECGGVSGDGRKNTWRSRRPAQSVVAGRYSQIPSEGRVTTYDWAVFEFPSLPRGEPLSVSASLYTTYLRCPGQALAHAQGVYGPDSRASFSGMLAHRVFARHLSTGPIAEADFAQACREEIGLAMNPKLGSLHLRPSELRGVIDEVGALYERFQAAPLEGCRSVETELAVEVSPDVTLRGRIDAVFDDPTGVRLVDWKTGALGGAQDQLSFYSMLWGLEHGELPAIVEAASVASGERYEELPTAASAVATGRRVAELVATLRGGFIDGAAVPRVGGPGCRYCPWRDECEEGVAALRVLSA